MSHSSYWYWGKHAVDAILRNPLRSIEALFCTSDQAPSGPAHFPVHRVTSQQLTKLLPHGAVHQGIAVKALVLPDWPEQRMDPSQGHVLVLDSVTDPHNVGALWRSAAVFGLQTVVMTKDRAPDLNGTVAKAACGAMELVPLVRVTNLVRTLEGLKRKGFFVVGLAEKGEVVVDNMPDDPVALVIGAEESGLRRLTKETCDVLVSIPTATNFSTLNASVAGAIAMHCLPRSKGNVQSKGPVPKALGMP